MQILFRFALFFKKVTIFCSLSIVTCTVLVILFLTLEPFNFSLQVFQDGFDVKDNCRSFFQFTPARDVARNILLFSPFGFGITAFCHRIKLKSRTILFLVLIASFGLSFLVESLQMFLPPRCPSLSDLVANSLGGFLGFACLNYILVWISNFQKGDRTRI